MPIRLKEEGQKESRRALDSRQAKKGESKGIEEGSRCPSDRKKSAKEN